MPLALITGVARVNGIAAGIVPRLVDDGWDVVTSDLAGSDHDCDLADATAPAELIDQVCTERGPIGALVLSHSHDVESGILPYGASKGALDRIVISAARELGPLGISANVLNPGPIDTGWMDDETREGLLPYHPLGRLGEPRDIAGVVAFLLSPAGRWVSGQLLHVDGGFSARF